MSGTAKFKELGLTHDQIKQLLELPTIVLPDAYDCKPQYYLSLQQMFLISTFGRTSARFTKTRRYKGGTNRRKPTPKIHFPPLPSITLPSQEVLVAASVTAVTAVAAATVTQPVINALKDKKYKSFYKQDKKWKENRKKKRDSLQSSKKT